MTDFREQIRALLKVKRMSISQLARRADLNAQTIYNFLTGKSEMTAGNLSKVLDVLNK